MEKIEIFKSILNVGAELVFIYKEKNIMLA